MHEPKADRSFFTATQTQKLVDQHFDKVASYWKDIYCEKDVFAVVHQIRRAKVLATIDRLRIPASSRMLDIGCGAGAVAIELARRGYVVEATDSVPAMVDLARKHANEAGLASSVTASVGDAHRLAFSDAFFDAVVAMGVTPFLHSLPDALREMDRVLKPGGYLLISADNCWRVSHLLDPMRSLLLNWLRQGVKKTLEFVRLRERKSAPTLVHMYSRREFDFSLRAAGFDIVERCTFGYGPFTFMGRKVLPDGMGIRVHRFLQGCANRGFPFIGACGAQYVVLATKGQGRTTSK